MTIEELKASGCIIFECISGSKSYGLDTATSDTDIKGVFILPKEKYYSLNYIGQINNETNDIVYYELQKFIELLSKNNPNILELLNIPAKCVLYKHPVYDLIKLEDFLSKLCKDTFANYAFTQIKKARGLNKKIVNPVNEVKKSVEDFCFVRTDKKTVALSVFLKHEQLKSSDFGLVKLSNMKDCYNLYHSDTIHYNGISRPNANDICLSSVPKTESPIGLLFFNSEGYSSYCKKYKEYWKWVQERNEERYQKNISHSKNYDSKNMMHTFRLLLMAREIGLEGKLNVLRNDRDFLLSIKNADFEYDDLVDKAEKMKDDLDTIYFESDLIDRPNLEKINNLLFNLRNEFYNNFK
uniref:nucleotidyltransferase domain-containing protein n=1 Tax=Gelidibacter sp. TaxID=2018083 RepID=UPI00404B1516